MPSCIASDPTEDTESQGPALSTSRPFAVASPPIRPRILKVPAKRGSQRSVDRGCIASDPTEDTERTPPATLTSGATASCIASDPTEDTESRARRGCAKRQAVVASPPIRPRILKVLGR